MWNYLKKSTTLYLLIAVCGGFFGGFMMRYCADGRCFSPTHQLLVDADLYNRMISKSEFYVWLYFMALLFAFAFLAAFPLWSSLREFKKYLSRSRILDLGVAFGLILLIFAIPDGLITFAEHQVQLPIYGFTARILTLLLVDFACMLPSMAGIWLIRDALEDKFRAFTADPSPECAVEFLNAHIRLRDLSREYLTIIGINNALVTVTTAVNRSLRIAANIDPGSLPPFVVLVYGLYFTLVVALIYLPTYYFLAGTGRQVSEVFYPADLPQTFVNVLNKRAALGEKLQINLNAAQSLGAGLVILSPLLTGIFTNLLMK